ncbi:hypothetical protein V8E55_010723 [Tylopilus felleus]
MLAVPSTSNFSALHFSWYNRHCTQGHSVPKDVQPQWLAVENRMSTNYTQLIPYLSREMREYSITLHSIEVAFADIFEYLRNKIELYLPDDYKLLSATADMLPENNVSGIYPFLSLVINLNVYTTTHRDGGDQNLCLVMLIGKFEGGALAMVETGLVVELHQDDWILFRSCDITHFNLHYTGTRASLVLHTDHAMATWLKDRNGLASNQTMLTFPS